VLLRLTLAVGFVWPWLPTLCFRNRSREILGTVSFIAPIAEPARSGSRGRRNEPRVDVLEVLIDLADPGPLAVGMKVDAFFFARIT
jgi:hypothetical protein